MRQSYELHQRKRADSRGDGGQRGVRLRQLSLPCRDLCHAEDHPAEQRHRAQPRDHVPAAQLVPFGRQSERIYHRGVHHYRKQGFTNHQTVIGYEKKKYQKISVGRILETSRQEENVGGKAQRVSGRLAAEDTQSHCAGHVCHFRRACPPHLRQSRP